MLKVTRSNGFALLSKKLQDPPPGVQTHLGTSLGGLGYVGGWGRAPAARQARGPSAAARQGVTST